MIVTAQHFPIHLNNIQPQQRIMKRFIIFTFLTIFFFTATIMIQAQTWNVRDHIPLDELMIQCHRGAGNLSPENSLEAFEIAWGLATIPEADLRLTKDGVIVAFHDNNFKRILPNASAEMQNKGIADLTLEEVKKLDIGAWKGEKFVGQRVPTMKEICDILKKYPKRKVYIDIKKINFEQLAQETQNFHSQLILASTNYEEIKRWKKLAPKSFTLHWMGGTEEKLTERIDFLEKVQFGAVDQLQIHVNIDKNGKFSPSEDFLRKTGERLRKYNVLFQTLPWNGNDAKIYHRLLDIGAASFATDFPDVTIDAVRTYYKLKQ
jgi:glycerophosphoryl diester phosphodiesterase